MSTHAWSSVSEKNSRSRFLDSFFAGRFVAKRYIIHPIAKVSERTNRNLPASNTLVQLLKREAQYEG